MNTRSLLTTLAIVAISLVSQAQQATFSTDHRRLIDANGQTFVIRGMNNPHAWFGEKAYQALDAIHATRSNTIRIVWETKGRDADLERIIQRCIELEMIPMVELHDVTGNTSGDRLADMARWYAEPERVAMLRQYERYLLLNIANEWGDNKMKAQYWREAYERAISIMREAGYVTTLVIDAPGWGQNIDHIVTCGQQLIDADPQHNILFSVHMYGRWNHADRIVEQLTLCHTQELPIIVGEFGYNYANGRNNLHCKADHRTILATCCQLEYGYMPWSWTGNNKANQWLDLVESSDWLTLTWWGEQVISGENGITATARKASVFE